MFPRTVLAVLALAAILAAPAATAASSIKITGLADVAEPINTKGEAHAAFKLYFNADGFGCPAASAVKIQITVAGTFPAGSNVSAMPAEVTIAVPQGLYQDVPNPGLPAAPPIGAFNGSAAGGVMITVTNVTANESVPVTVSAAYKGGAPDGCQASPAGDVPAAKGDGKFAFTLVAPPPPPKPTVAAAKKSFLPDVSVGAAVLAAALVALVARRRR